MGGERVRECKEAVATHTALNGLEKVGKKVRANKENDGKIDGIYTHAKNHTCVDFLSPFKRFTCSHFLGIETKIPPNINSNNNNNCADKI